MICVGFHWTVGKICFRRHPHTMRKSGASAASRAVVLVGCVFLALGGAAALAEDWPGWRGPRGDGSSRGAHVPTSWNGETGENIRWKVAVPGSGHSSPIVWKNRVFLASCREATKERLLVCLDRASGELVWERAVVQAPLEVKHALNSYASSTPATDGERVYVTFLKVSGRTVPAPNVGRQRPVTPGQVVVAAYDFAGEQQWLVEIGDFVSAHGFCSSPVLYGDLLIINGDHDGNSYLAALDKRTGKEVWKVSREHKTRSYVTPLIRELDGTPQLVVSGSKCVVSLDPRSGRRHWSVQGPTEQFVASMVFDGERFILAAGFPTHHVMAIRPDGAGDVTDTHVAWHVTNAKCYVPSPVLTGDYLIVADDRGTANCFIAQTGERLWQARMGKHYSASLVTAGGLAYLLADDGITKLIRPGKEVEVVAENPLGEYCYASPAIAGDQLFIRGEKHLFCIEQTPGNDTSGR